VRFICTHGVRATSVVRNAPTCVHLGADANEGDAYATTCAFLHTGENVSWITGGQAALKHEHFLGAIRWSNSERFESTFKAVLHGELTARFKSFGKSRGVLRWRGAERSERVGNAGRQAVDSEL
jgi:hypothetical protein